MLFNSFEFILAFLPTTLLGFLLLLKFAGREPAFAWLVATSLFFYGWWNPAYLPLIIGSMVFNYLFGQVLTRRMQGRCVSHRRAVLALGVAANLGLLGYFKYANFFVDNVNLLAGTDLQLQTIVLPLAISFFTFQQVAYLVDAYKGITSEYNFLHYSLFVSFFPQLIAGPIVHHKEMLPQFMSDERTRKVAEDLAVGIAIFSIGLFKKAVLADGVAPYANGVFDGAAQGETVSFFWAWGGALAYTLQLYFDFSGYSDMAIGAARMFGVRLPLNFHSPYKATSIIEFWRRWHITLSRFLRDYLYIPLGGNRRGRARRHANLLITMLLGGLWHGAGWTFVVWGGLHGAYLIANNMWRSAKKSLGINLTRWARTRKAFAWFATFMAVVIGWVFFRAADLATAQTMLYAMSGAYGVDIPNGIAVRLGDLADTLTAWGVTFQHGGGSQFVFTWLWVASLMALALFLPNTQQLMAAMRPALSRYAGDQGQAIWMEGAFASRLRFNWGWRSTAGIAVLSVAGFLALSEVSEFLYFQF